MRLIFESWIRLLYFDFLMRLRGFQAIHKAVKSQQVCIAPRSRNRDVDVCHAVDLACVFYFKRVLCLQRSAATTVLLRLHGWDAEMVLGAQLLPFHSHAWVEIDNRVVNDKPYVSEMFQILDRC
jgi:hypothetical protein